jgi:hypothetical protein
MTVEELILRLDHARDDAQVFVGDASNYKAIIGIEKDADGDVILVTEGDEITTNLTSEDDL